MAVVVYMDLLCFGYGWSDKRSGELQSKFIKEVKEKFPNVVLVDAYDSIKGFRQVVYLESSENDNYFSWLIAKQWWEPSMTMQLVMATTYLDEMKEKFERYFALAKKQYPEEFKPEFLNEK